MEQKVFEIILDNVQDIAPDVKHFIFKKPLGEPIKFIPGQFITLRLEHEGKTIRRSYSMASMGKLMENQEPVVSPLTFHCTSDSIEFAASYLPHGIASEFLFHLKPGDKVTASGPFGRLILRDDHPQRYFLIATGTGVTPYRAMLPEIRQRFVLHPDLKVVLFLGVRERSHALYAEEFRKFQQEEPRFDFHVFYSRAYPTDALAFEHFGHVQTGFKDYVFFQKMT